MSKQRGFEPVKEEMMQGEKEFILPIRGSKNSACYDFHTPETLHIEPGKSVMVHTNVKAYMKKDEVLMLFIRSSMGIKKNLKIKNQVGIIDSDYYENEGNEGNICFCLENNGNKEVIIDDGVRIGQGMFTKYLLTDDDKTENDRVGGVGSTGF